MKIRRYIEIAGIVICLILPFIFAPHDANMKDLKEVADQYSDKEIMERIDDSYIFSKYHLVNDYYEEVYGYGPISYMDVDEIIIFKQSDETLRKQVFESVESHIKNQISTFEGYGIKQTEKLKASFVEEKGSYVICVVSKNVKEIKNKMLACY